MPEEEKFLLKQLLGLSKKADSGNRVLFSDFLNMNEIDLLLQHQPEIDTKFQLYGGYESSERQMVAFIPDALSFTKKDIRYPIVCLKVSPRHAKFAETLTHRDVLGACMHLGIERKLLGDILFREKNGYLFCCERIAAFLTDELDKIRHTYVTVTICEEEMGAVSPKKEAFRATLSSVRLDCVIAACCNISRKEAAGLILAKSVFVNARSMTKPDYLCSENDILSVRGHGKYVFSDMQGVSKKGKLRVTLEKYV